jgi:diaminopimelate decarboxylase
MRDVSVDSLLRFSRYDLRELALIAGRTPFFAYSRETISGRIAQLRTIFPEAVHWYYSLKANPWGPIAQHLANHIDGLDVSSSSELKTAFSTGIAPEAITLTGPAKTDEEIVCAIASAMTISVESRHEIDRTIGLARQIGRPARVLLRVNPGFTLRGVGLRMGGVPRQFGIDQSDCPGALQAMASPWIHFRGLHIFWGSQCLNAETIIGAHEGCLTTTAELAPFFPSEPEVLNFGGGFGIPYADADTALDVSKVAKGMTAWLPRAERSWPKAKFVLELGRYFVGSAGIYVCRVIDKKSSRGETFLVTDGGMHHHLAASGNLGQVRRRNYPLIIGNRMDHARSEIVNITGCLCTPIDVLAHQVAVPPTEIGDYVVIFQSGAYARSASPNDFLGHPPPVEIMV